LINILTTTVAKSTQDEQREAELFDNEIGLLTVERLAAIFDRSPKTVRHWVCKRIIPSVRVQGRTYFLAKSVKAWLQNQEMKSCQ
jgi:prophage antirepressor-like protein